MATASSGSEAGNRIRDQHFCANEPNVLQNLHKLGQQKRHQRLYEVSVRLSVCLHAFLYWQSVLLASSRPELNSLLQRLWNIMIRFIFSHWVQGNKGQSFFVYTTELESPTLVAKMKRHKLIILLLFQRCRFRKWNSKFFKRLGLASLDYPIICKENRHPDCLRQSLANGVRPCEQTSSLKRSIQTTFSSIPFSLRSWPIEAGWDSNIGISSYIGSFS